MFKYSINQPISNVIVVGCGGTGSRAVPTMAQLLVSNQFTKNIRMTLIDGDVVEEKNTKRQLFIKGEVGKNKAEVLARRYSIGFDARMEAVRYFVPTSEEQYKFIRFIRNYRRGGRRTVSSSDTPSQETIKFFCSLYKALTNRLGEAPAYQSWTENEDEVEVVLQSLSMRSDSLERILTSAACLIVMCVDSVDARRSILDCMHILMDMSNCPASALANFVVIDAGNEDIFGQVSYFNLLTPTVCPFKDLVDTIPDRVPYELKLRYVPFPVGKYSRMVPGESTKSCADMDQTLAINNLMASMITMVFQNLLYGFEMDYHTVYCNLNGSFYADKMSVAWMKGVVGKDENYLSGVIKDRFPNSKWNVEQDTFKSAEDVFRLANALQDDEVKREVFPYLGLALAEVTRDHYMNLDPGTPSIELPISSFGSDTGINPLGPHSGYDDRYREPLQIYRERLHLYSSWQNLVWPVIMEGIRSKFTPSNEVIKKYAILGLGMGPTPAVTYSPYSSYLNTGVDIYSFMNNCLRDVPAGSVFILTCSELGYHHSASTVGEQAAESLLNKSLKIGLKARARENEAILVLPTRAGHLIAGVDSIEIDHGDEDVSYATVPSVIREAILSSMTNEEILRIHEELRLLRAQLISTPENLSIGRSYFILPSVEYLVAKTYSYTNGWDVRTTPTGIFKRETPNDLNYRIHGSRIVNEEFGMSVVSGFSTRIFGKAVNESDMFINLSGRVEFKKDLPKVEDCLKTLTKELKAG